MYLLSQLPRLASYSIFQHPRSHEDYSQNDEARVFPGMNLLFGILDVIY